MLFRAVGTPLGKALTTLDGAAVHLAGRIRRRRDGATFLAIDDAAMPVVKAADDGSATVDQRGSISP